MENQGSDNLHSSIQPPPMPFSMVTYPPEPPDLDPMKLDHPLPTKPTFIQKLLTLHSSNIGIDEKIAPHYPDDVLVEDSNLTEESDNFIPLSSEGKNQLYLPWKFSVIIKLFGKKTSHQGGNPILREEITPITQRGNSTHQSVAKTQEVEQGISVKLFHATTEVAVLTPRVRMM
ncbi:hypothetical protein RND71_007987 [Anisodus tanguticus]|uniref:Uncharacterized protein n=1 Tax=Anisodus tanguticus TaxID=243964 RepID=A0AAE1SNB9_9SOLA|nr:hypothetical protein RND71_007987 [Anisodus tanguticus]